MADFWAAIPISSQTSSRSHSGHANCQQTSMTGSSSRGSMARSFLAMSLLSSVLLALAVPAASQCKYPLFLEGYRTITYRVVACQASSGLQLEKQLLASCRGQSN